MTGRSTTISSFLSVCLWTFLMSACNPQRPPDYGAECDPEDVSACSEGMECVWTEDSTLADAWRCSMSCSSDVECPKVDCHGPTYCGIIVGCPKPRGHCLDDGYCRVCYEGD